MPLEAQIADHSEAPGIARKPTATREALRLLFVVLFGIVASLVLVEAAFRMLAPSLAPVKWSDRPHFFYVPPQAKTLQDFERTEQKPAQTFRIMVVGDSFTFGPKMQFDDTFSKRLERILSMNDGPLKAQVLNFGISGYSTADEVNVIKKAKDWNADLVLLQITLNDPELQTLRASGGNAKRFGPLRIDREHTPLLYYWKSLGYVAQRLHASATRRRYRDYFFDLFDNARTWGPFKEAFEEIARVRDQTGIPVRAVLFPLMSFGFDDSYPFTDIHSKISALCAGLKIPMLDLFGAYRNIPAERMQVVPVGDPHPNEIAHRIAAEQIYTWLAWENVIPESLKISQASWQRENARFYAQYDCKKQPRTCFGRAERYQSEPASEVAPEEEQDGN